MRVQFGIEINTLQLHILLSRDIATCYLVGYSKRAILGCITIIIDLNLMKR